MAQASHRRPRRSVPVHRSARCRPRARHDGGRHPAGAGLRRRGGAGAWVRPSWPRAWSRPSWPVPPSSRVRPSWPVPPSSRRAFLAGAPSWPVPPSWPEPPSWPAPPSWRSAFFAGAAFFAGRLLRGRRLLGRCRLLRRRPSSPAPPSWPVPPSSREPPSWPVPPSSRAWPSWPVRLLGAGRSGLGGRATRAARRAGDGSLGQASAGRHDLLEGRAGAELRHRRSS